MLPIRYVYNILIRNIKKTGFPFPISPERRYGWAKEINLPRQHDTVLYTSCLYQLVPYINAMVRFLEKAEKSSLWRFGIKMYSKFEFLDKFSGLFIRVSNKEIDPINNILKSIALLLRYAGIDFGYLYEDDIYCGALLYDLGLDQLFKKHAEMIYGILKKNNVKKIITIDPHTYHTFNTLFPKYVDGFDYEVVSYLELLDEKLPVASNKINETYTIHDPCIYARWENIIDPPRNLLERVGAQIVESKKSKVNTTCCGGPIESLAPEMSKAVALGRLNELKEASTKIITMCPICYANLGRYAKALNLEIMDLSQVLAKAFNII